MVTSLDRLLKTWRRATQGSNKLTSCIGRAKGLVMYLKVVDDIRRKKESKQDDRSNGEEEFLFFFFRRSSSSSSSSAGSMTWNTVCVI